MKKLLSTLLALCLLLCCVAPAGAEAEEEPAEGKLIFGYLAPAAEEGSREALLAEAFAYAAQRKGVETIIVRYDPEDAREEAPEAVPSEADGEAEPDPQESPAMLALKALMESDIDGVVIAPEALEQAVELAEFADAAGLPAVIDGIDMTPAYEPTPDPEDLEWRPYVAAVCYADAAAYAAAMWLDEHAPGSLALHCALPQADPAIQQGLDRAMSEAKRVEISNEIAAEADSADAGASVVRRMYNAYTMFDCVFADSAALAEGCAAALGEQGEGQPVAAIASGTEALDLLDGGAVKMLAANPAAIEGVACFKALYGYVTEEILPEGEARLLRPEAAIATSEDRSGWIADDDFEAAYEQAYPEDTEAEAEAEEEAEPAED